MDINYGQHNNYISLAILLFAACAGLYNCDSIKYGVLPLPFAPKEIDRSDFLAASFHLLRLCVIPAAIIYVGRLRSQPLYIFGAIFAFLLYTVESYALADCYFEDLNIGFVTLTWIFLVAVLFAIGIISHIRAARKIALFIAGAAVVKLFFIDVATMDVGPCVIVFAFVGIVLFTIASLYFKFQEKIGGEE